MVTVCLRVTGISIHSWMGNWSTDTILKRNKTSMGERGEVDCKSDKLGLEIVEQEELQRHKWVANK